MDEWEVGTAEREEERGDEWKPRLQSKADDRNSEETGEARRHCCSQMAMQTLAPVIVADLVKADWQAAEATKATEMTATI